MKCCQWSRMKCPSTSCRHSVGKELPSVRERGHIVKDYHFRLATASSDVARCSSVLVKSVRMQRIEGSDAPEKVDLV